MKDSKKLMLLIATIHHLVGVIQGTEGLDKEELKDVLALMGLDYEELVTKHILEVIKILSTEVVKINIDNTLLAELEESEVDELV